MVVVLVVTSLDASASLRGTNALQPVTLPAMVIRIASSRCGPGMPAHLLLAFVAVGSKRFPVMLVSIVLDFKRTQATTIPFHGAPINHPASLFIH